MFTIYVIMLHIVTITGAPYQLAVKTLAKYTLYGRIYMSQPFKNSYKVENKEMMSLSVYNVGFQKCEPLYQWGPGIRDHYLIHHIVSGRGIYEVNGECFHLQSGDTFLVYPNTEILYYADENEPWEYYWVGFSGSDTSTILHATDFSSKTPVIYHNDYGALIKDHIINIYDARGNHLPDSVRMTGHLYITLALLITGSTTTNKQKDSSLFYTQKAVEYICYHYSYPISIEDVADYVGISRSHLFRCFQNNLSISPKEYLTEYRIRQACQLLKDSSLSVASIAKSVGFENNLYFSKAFHKKKGITPTGYARKYKTNVSDCNV